ncbi:hypothetical protein [Rhodococcus sp. MALMAid1271]|uniref:hypothetical protein n=1 Tax=Rhodococcus sp. MALMAid1271 TaxID=3411744 RepID=UPI003B9F7179
MSAIFFLIFVGLAIAGVWSTWSFWTDGQYRRNAPPADLSGFRSQDHDVDDNIRPD